MPGFCPHELAKQRLEDRYLRRDRVSPCLVREDTGHLLLYVFEIPRRLLRVREIRCPEVFACEVDHPGRFPIHL